jgi:S1-C subfamily serine protease
VLEIFPGSGAEAAGLQHDDVLLARDGEPMWERSCREDASYDTAPKEVTLTVRRDGQEVDLTVTTRILVP